MVGPFAQANALEPIMLWILLFSMVTFLILFAYLVVERTALRNCEDRLRGIRLVARRAGR